MENIATSVRITGDANDVLSKLSEKFGQSKAQVIETALVEMGERIFWDEVRQAFDRIAADPAESNDQTAEVHLWDRGTACDFQAETW